MTRRALLALSLLPLIGCVRPRVQFEPSRDPIARVLWPTLPWEGTCAMPFSGGVHYDATDQVWKCWYMGGWPQNSALGLAVSEDARHWTKRPEPVLRIPGLDTATVVPHAGRWYLAYTRGNGPLWLMDSLEGMHWTPQGQTPDVGDRTTLWWNPIRERWSFNVRAGAGCCSDPRRVDLVESETFVPTTWAPRPWLAADAEDGCGEFCGSGQGQLYAVDVVPWEDHLLGLLTIWRGLAPNRPKLNDVCWALSRDGLTWERPDRQPFLSPSDDPTSWRYGNVQAVAGGVQVVHGRVLAFCSGRSAANVCAMGVHELTAVPWAVAA
jgi:hypothetical protein